MLEGEDAELPNAVCGFPQTPKAKHNSRLSTEGMSTSLGGLFSGPPFPKSLPPPLNLLDDLHPMLGKLHTLLRGLAWPCNSSPSFQWLVCELQYLCSSFPEAG